MEIQWNLELMGTLFDGDFSCRGGLVCIWLQRDVFCVVHYITVVVVEGDVM